MTKISTAELSSRESLRRECLINRPFGQESYLESIAKTAALKEIDLGGTKCGYVLVKDECIVEFFLFPSCEAKVREVMVAVVETTGAKTALCQSFDVPLRAACEGFSWDSKPVGFLFREFDKSLLGSNLIAKLANQSQIPEVLSIHDGFFDDEDEICFYLQQNARLFIYRHGETPVACGIVKQVVECRNDYDVGMVVAPNERGKGYGAQVVNHLKHFCIAQGWNPIAGCSVDNPASKRSLERAGFVSKHQLIKFTRS